MTDEATGQTEQAPQNDQEFNDEIRAIFSDDSTPPSPPEAEATETGAPAPISASDVAGEKAAPPTAPDSTALRDAMRAARPQPDAQQDPREAELAQLRQAVSQMAAVHQVATTGKTAAQLLEERNSPQSMAQQAIDEAKKARAESEQYAQQLAQWQEGQRQRDQLAGLTEYVTANKEFFPLTNELKSSDLVYAVMEENPELSETQASTHVEEKLLDFVDRGAKLLGYVKGEQPGKAAENSDTESPTLGPSGAGASVPKGWDTMSDDERDAELARQLKTALGGQTFNP